MGVKKKKLVPPSPKGGTSPKPEPKMEQNRVRLGSRATIGKRASLGVKK